MARTHQLYPGGCSELSATAASDAERVVSRKVGQPARREGRPNQRAGTGPQECFQTEEQLDQGVELSEEEDQVQFQFAFRNWRVCEGKFACMPDTRYRHPQPLQLA